MIYLQSSPVHIHIHLNMNAPLWLWPCLCANAYTEFVISVSSDGLRWFGALCTRDTPTDEVHLDCAVVTIGRAHTTRLMDEQMKNSVMVMGFARRPPENRLAFSNVSQNYEMGKKRQEFMTTNVEKKRKENNKLGRAQLSGMEWRWGRPVTSDRMNGMR